MDNWQRYAADRSIENRDRLVEQYYDLAIALAHRHCGTFDLDEIISFALEALFKAIERIDPEREGKVSYLIRAIKQGILWKKRDEGLEFPHLELSVDVARPEPQESYFDDLVAGLPTHEQHLFRLRFVEGYTYSEIGERLDRSYTAVRWFFNSRMARVRKQVEALGV